MNVGVVTINIIKQKVTRSYEIKYATNCSEMSWFHFTNESD